ncbi:hypothetical protein DFP72DRAFT_811948 [Ephemerocybe angulata]|uniref:Uncharacterized protein n=1 Tax=Ephemerocybe angulata TaxID=980116 RepID=A0A8H6HXX3_9AGAR|nr:hypothetical protein DFP72DRAFT_811948 [Tulosesus angulatus]
MGIGSVVLEFTGADGIITSRTITGVIHVPYADTCLLSVSRLDVDGFRVEFNGGTCVIKDGDGKIFGLGEVENWLYRLDARAASVSESMAKQEEEFDEGPVTTADWEAVRDGELWL